MSTLVLLTSPVSFEVLLFSNAGGDFGLAETYQSPRQAKQRSWTWLWSGRWLEGI
jgi:hypothetical protein